MLHYHIIIELDTHTRNVILLFEYKHVKERKLVNLKIIITFIDLHLFIVMININTNNLYYFS